MNLEIQINTDNDAFHQGDKSGTVMREELMHLVESAVDHYVNSLPYVFEDETATETLQDGNGNRVGLVRTFGNDFIHKRRTLCKFIQNSTPIA